MCLIIASPTGAKPDTELLWNAITDNPDGWGIVAIDEGKLTAWRGFGMPDLAERLDAVTGAYCLHFRFATHGAVGLQNCHPFRINKGLYMMHNGILRIPLADQTRSDTWNFARHYVKPYLHTHGMNNLIADAEHFIGRGNKLAFMTREGDILIANESAGTWEDGMWFSNTYSFPAPKAYGSLDWLDKLRANSWASCSAAKAEPDQPQLDSITLDLGDESPCDVCDLPVNRLYHDPETNMYICADCAAMDLADDMEQDESERDLWQ
jgi:hypothetical protein